MMRRLSFTCGIAVLVLAWGAAGISAHSFTMHMIVHMSVVAVAAPLMALGVVGTRLDPTATYPALFAALPASVLELVVVWGWHAPVPHSLARSYAAVMVLEQASFLSAGLLLWLACLSAAGGMQRRAAGAVGLLFTSMHMTLLGVLLTLAPRPLYVQAAHAEQAQHAVADQSLGGIVMLAVGGAIYLAGGLALVARLLSGRAVADQT